MRPFRTTRSNTHLLLRSALLLASVATYFVSPDDVVWRFIKANPHARGLEHLAFGFAACLLGTTLYLKVRNSILSSESSLQDELSHLLQSVGFGFLLPLPGFLLLVFGQLAIDFFTGEPLPEAPGQTPHLPIRTSAALAAHLGLCCAFVSMVVFSIVLVDRVADALFAASALTSLAASVARALNSRRRS